MMPDAPEHRRSPDAMLAELRERIASTFMEVVSRRRKRFSDRGITPREEPLELLLISTRLYRWRARRHQEPT